MTSGTMESDPVLLRCLKARRLAFEHENATLSPEQLDEKWSQLWNSISTEVNSVKTSLVPMKRSSHDAQFGLDSGPKRYAVSLSFGLTTILV